ncbi:dethiobiotin synthase [Legionella septentrionalis]|uniref:ATP-dependent dethiobiotin synthetase BioD n=1 Tax=Legionella septentrionalis TaxID=2498109 RepID=A0A433JKR8_9GAMM|nr:dethiobiotin synthase [Legionella septentrionalis]RUQ89499.1 dethiobiotin synthase [Legionella septentrionalis]
MLKRFFITGTDTECGKTYVTCQLLHHLKQGGKRARAIKPVASGYTEKNGCLVNEDIDSLQQFNGDTETICPWPLSLPLSPHLAALHDGKKLSAQEIAAYCLEKNVNDLDYLLIEGAGGLMAPLNSSETWLDFLRISKIPVILVVGMRLGCLNHALLTAAVLEAQHISCAGWIANCLDETMAERAANIGTLLDKLHAPHLATVEPHGSITKFSL